MRELAGGGSVDLALGVAVAVDVSVTVVVAVVVDLFALVLVLLSAHIKRFSGLSYAAFLCTDTLSLPFFQLSPCLTLPLPRYHS